MRIFIKLFFILSLFSSIAFAQPGRSIPQAPKDPIVEAIIKEATTNSQLEKLGHELIDGIGPRLVGSPKMRQAHDWVVKKYTDWNIPARNEKWGEWRGWERGITHIDMISPWIKSLAGTQLAWSPSTKGKTVTGDVVIIPELADSIAFQKWLPSVKGKFVMISMNQPTGRNDENWEKYGTKDSFEKMKKDRQAQTTAWADRIKKTGKNNNTLPVVLENAGAAGIVMCYWSKFSGANKIFGAKTKKVPTLDLMVEDYGLLYRLTESEKATKISVRADSKETGVTPTYNTLAEIKSSTNPDEYVMLSAHLDSWDGATGATDNGTGTLVMLEAMRILKAVYPNPKRTILVGHWSSEEQGLNGSRSFIEDHPEIVKNIQVLFNQDNGTGRITNISGQGFLHAYEYITRWLSKVPAEYKVELETTFPGYPGNPGGGGSDYISFVSAGVPAFPLNALSWDYTTYTWHTNLDTYDKIVFDDVRNNAILAATLAYLACEDSNRVSGEKSVLPLNSRTGEPDKWPEQKKPKRKGE